AMKMYMGGQLKIGGNVMASQKLGDVLKGIDREAAMKAYLAKHGGAAAVAGAAPKAAAKAAPAAPLGTATRAPAIFDALKDRLAKNPSLAKEVGKLLQFNVKGTDKAYVVDLSGTGAVKEGKDANAAATFTIADDDLVTLA